MSRSTVIFFQSIVVLMGVMAIYILIQYPLIEGRMQNLDLLSIYLNPLVLYGYASSSAFFVGLYHVFNLFIYIQQDKLFTPDGLKALRIIRYCAYIFGVLIALAGLYVWLFYDKKVDATVFLTLVILVTIMSFVAAISVGQFEKSILKQNDYDDDSEFDL